MKRIPAFDIAKGIGILCVIFGHLRWATSTRIVYPFHMPLFFIISGWFISDKSSLKHSLIKRIETLLPPYIFTSLVLMVFAGIWELLQTGNAAFAIKKVLEVFIKALYGSGAIENKTLFSIGFIGAIWFLPALVWATFFVQWIIRSFKNVKFQLFLICLLFIICWQTSKVVFLPFDIQTGGCCAFYVYIGWFIRSYRDNEQNKVFFDRIRKWVIPVGGFAWIYDFILWIYPTIAWLSFPYFPISAIMAVPICFAIIQISQNISNTFYLSRFLEIVGQLSLPILCFHLIELKCIPWGDVYLWLNGLGIGTTCQFLIGFILESTLCIALAMLSRRNELMRSVFHLSAQR